MLGIDTTDTATFVDETLDSPAFARMIDKIEVRTDRGLGHTQARVELRANGYSLKQFHDTGIPATDLEAQGAKLAAKMTGLTAPLLGTEASDRLRELSLHLEAVGDVRDPRRAPRRFARSGVRHASRRGIRPVGLCVGYTAAIAAVTIRATTRHGGPPT